MLAFDHLAVSAATLDEGAAHVEAALGVALATGGEHPLMGTHNRLLSLGPEEYLEVIAINPEAPDPGHARWFDLDRFVGKPRITNWVARTNDINAALSHAPPGSGLPLALTRGDLSWTMLVPPSGQLPFDGAFPALIEWDGAIHPADRLPDAGVRLNSLEISHAGPVGCFENRANVEFCPRQEVNPGILYQRFKRRLDTRDLGV